MPTVTVIDPLYDRVLCKRVEAATHTEGAGLFIPEAARERPQEAIVVAVGCGKFIEGIGGYRPVHVKAGDRILVGKYAGAEVSVGQNNYLILREDEVLGIVRTEEQEEA